MKHAAKKLAHRLGLDVHRVIAGQRPADMGAALTWLGGLGLEVATVLDVGASDGRWTGDCRNVFTEAAHVMYEPQPVHRAALDEFLSTHPNTFLEAAAVGNRVGTARFDATDALGGALVDPENDLGVAATIEVPLVTLDESVERLGKPGPYLIKLDTHGFERGILEGADKVLDNTTILIIEAYTHKLTSEGLLFWELCAMLDERGFKVADIVDVLYRQRDLSLWQMDLVFVTKDWDGWNHPTWQ